MRSVAIVGGGIGGLALAATLDPEQFAVTVYEQEPGRTGGETALAMWPGAQRALCGMGANRVLEDAVHAPAGSLRDSYGIPYASLGSAARLIQLVGRPALIRDLRAAVPATTTFIEAGIVDPSGFDTDLVVGADGVHSVVRRLIFGIRSSSRLTPYLAVRGTLAGDPPPAEVGEYWGAGQLFGITPVRAGKTNWFCSYRSDLGPRNVDVAVALDDARSRFDGWAPAVDRVLNAADPGTTLAQRIWIVPPLHRYSFRNIVLIGDAAHAMSPNLGRGACEAIVDAYVLGTELNHRDCEGAIRAYNRRRVVPTQLARSGSSALMSVATARRTAGVRDATLRLVRTLNVS